MFPLCTKTGRTLIAATVALACAPAVASALPIDVAPIQDLRSPDARDAADRDQNPTSGLAGTTWQDLRSPDARDAAQGRKRDDGRYRQTPAQDLRSPDTREAALSQGLLEQPTFSDDRAPSPASVTPPAQGFDWADAAIGAAGAVGVLLFAAAGVAFTRRRTRRDQPVAVS